ncbi:MAG: universal stress protein [Gammaproteobacteria bacterium]|nr:MAG: universal stress protein [Gammaproteobacteria bacterium]
MNNHDSLYRHILVGLDLTDETPQVLSKAIKIARTYKAQLSIAHVLEPITFAYGGDMPLDISDVQAQQVQRIENELQELIKNIDYPVAQEHVLVGQPASELHYLAEQQEADLIIVGSHGRKGFALLLGSTPNSVLHGATCDVLAVYVAPVTQVG